MLGSFSISLAPLRCSMSAPKTLFPPGPAITSNGQSILPPPIFEQKTDPPSLRKPLVTTYFFSFSGEQIFESSARTASFLQPASSDPPSNNETAKSFLNITYLPLLRLEVSSETLRHI